MGGGSRIQVVKKEEGNGVCWYLVGDRWQKLDTVAR